MILVVALVKKNYIYIAYTNQFHEALFSFTFRGVMEMNLTQFGSQSLRGMVFTTRMWIAFFIWVADADAVPFPEEVPNKDRVPDEVEVVSKLKNSETTHQNIIISPNTIVSPKLRIKPDPENLIVARFVGDLSL